jgi:two-component sensor histidine kinase
MTMVGTSPGAHSRDSLALPTLRRLDWEESGGPPVAPPTQKGFGSRLLEELVARDLGGDTKLDFDKSGVRCGITASL